MNKTFISTFSFDDATMKCKMSGYNPISQIKNQKTGFYLVFGRR